jgi:hypothetical protein
MFRILLHDIWFLALRGRHIGSVQEKLLRRTMTWNLAQSDRIRYIIDENLNTFGQPSTCIRRILTHFFEVHKVDPNDNIHDEVRMRIHSGYIHSEA